MNISGARVSMSLNAGCYGTSNGARSPTYDPAFAWANAFADGNGALQFTTVYDLTHLLSPLGSVSLDMNNLTDALAAAMNFAEVKAVVIHNTGSIDMVVSGNLGFSMPLPAGAALVWAAVDAAGISVANGSRDTLTITNGAGSGSVRVVICGD